jgi:hypothetical protein
VKTFVDNDILQITRKVNFIMSEIYIHASLTHQVKRYIHAPMTHYIRYIEQIVRKDGKYISLTSLRTSHVHWKYTRIYIYDDIAV